MDSEIVYQIGLAVGTFLSAAYSAYKSSQASKNTNLSKNYVTDFSNRIKDLQKKQIFMAKKIINLDRSVRVLLENEGLKIEPDKTLDDLEKMIVNGSLLDSDKED